MEGEILPLVRGVFQGFVAESVVLAVKDADVCEVEYLEPRPRVVPVFRFS